MTNLVSILKSRDITLPTKVRLLKAMVFSLVMYEYESWTVKKAQAMATHSSVLAWRITGMGKPGGLPSMGLLAWQIPWTEEPGGLQSMGLLRDGHD